MNLLLINVLWPLFSILVVFCCSFFTQRRLYGISLWLSGFSFLLALWLWFFLDKSSSLFQYQITIFFVPNFSFNVLLGVDGISIYFLLLTNLIIYLCILSLDPFQKQFNEILIYLFFLQWGVLGAFSVLDLLGFFVFFEATLIPIFFIILIWGSRERKVRASYLIALYTIFGSVFMFFNILYIFSKTGTTNYTCLLSFSFTEEEQKFLWITFFIAFAAKIPLFPLHVWLPEAHVEAPTVGSVILAALLLKLGLYGIIRFSLPLYPFGTVFYTPLVYTFAIFGILYTCFTAIRQIDMKKIIAYASVGHMNVVLLGIMSLQLEGLEGALFQMLSHGIVSGALFFGVGSLYERYSIRSLKYLGGLASIYPMLAFFFLIFSLANISFPGTSSFVGEFLIFSGTFMSSPIAVFFGALSMILGAVYTLWMYNRVFFGNLKDLYIVKGIDLNRREFYLYSILVFVSLWMGVYSSSVLETFHSPCLFLLEQVNNNF